MVYSLRDVCYRLNDRLLVHLTKAYRAAAAHGHLVEVHWDVPGLEAKNALNARRSERVGSVERKVFVERTLANCLASNVLLVKLRAGADDTTPGNNRAMNAVAQEVLVPCVARLVVEPTRQFWREVGVWSSLHHENIVRFVGMCISAQGPLSLALYFPEGSVYSDNARLRSEVPANAPLSWGLRSGFTLHRWVKQLINAMHYLHGLKPWPVRRACVHQRTPSLHLTCARPRAHAAP